MTSGRNRYTSLFFDLDDTLWDTAHNNRECIEEIYHAYEFSRYYPSFENFFSVYMPYNEKLWKDYRDNRIDRQTLITERLLYVLRPMGLDDKTLALKINDDFLQRTAKKTKIICGAKELLAYLYPRYRLFILSNGFREIQFLKLKNAGLADFFERIILSEDVSVRKPHPKIFDYALKNTNSKRATSLMIGDSWEADIEGAQKARMDNIWFNPHRIVLTNVTPPTFEVFSLSEILTIL